MIEMKKLKIFAWLCTGIALFCWLEACCTFEIIVWYDEYHWALAALCFLLGGVGVHLITEEMDELFAYLLIPCVCSGSIGLLIPELRGSLLPQSSTVLFSCLLAWLMPLPAEDEEKEACE
jgi:hypothetical protein